MKKDAGVCVTGQAGIICMDDIRVLFLRSIHVIENLLRRLEKLYDILNNDCHRRQGKRQGQVENGFTNPQIKRRESNSDPDRITPLTGDQFVET